MTTTIAPYSRFGTKTHLDTAATAKAAVIDEAQRAAVVVDDTDTIDAAAVVVVDEDIDTIVVTATPMKNRPLVGVAHSLRPQQRQPLLL